MLDFMLIYVMIPNFDVGMSWAQRFGLNHEKISSEENY